VSNTWNELGQELMSGEAAKEHVTTAYTECHPNPNY